MLWGRESKGTLQSVVHADKSRHPPCLLKAWHLVNRYGPRTRNGEISEVFGEFVRALDAADDCPERLAAPLLSAWDFDPDPAGNQT